MHPLFAHFPVSLSLAALLLEVLYVVFRSVKNSARANTFKIVAAAPTISYSGRLVFTYGVGTALVKSGMIDSTGSGDMDNMNMTPPDSIMHQGNALEQNGIGGHSH